MIATPLIRSGLIPALLVVLVGMLISYTAPDHGTSRRFRRYLLFIGALLSITVLVATPFAVFLYSRPAEHVLQQLVPTLTGILALVLLRSKRPAWLRRGAKVLAILLTLALFVILTWLSAYAYVFSILPDALLLAALWALVDRFDRSGTKLALISVALLAFYGVELITTSLLQPPNWIHLTFGIALFFMPKLGVALAATLISTGLRLLPSRHQGDSHPRTASTRWLPIAWRWGLAILLLGALAYLTVWSSIWDQTTDGLGGIFMSHWAGTVAVAAGTLMGFALSRWRRLAALVFAVLVPLAMFAAFEYGWQVSNHDITEGRAARIQRAIEGFYDRDGHYPHELGELVPRDLLWIPRPVIVYDHGWCYQGTADGYRLGTFYREYWSMPFSLRIYASAGSTPATEWACEQELAALKAQRDPPPMYEHTAPTAEPLPTSVLSIPRTPVQPLLKAQSIYLGTWSPDGEYLFLGSLDTSGAATSTALGFLDAKDGDICHAESISPMLGLGDRYAWLPDGRLLFLTEEGEMDLLRPCEADAERISDRYPVTFNELVAHDDQSGQILLKSDESFWILDGHSLEAQQIAEVEPNPYDLYWDDAAWSLDGERLAISRLNGRDRKAGSTLYLIAGHTGEVVKQLPLDYASDQHAPGIEWLSRDELLLHSEGVLAIVDVRTDPPGITNVLQDILDLDIAYPYETGAMAWIVHADHSYHFALWVNHPRNQDLYLYRSDTGGVDVLRPHVHTILLFSDGQWEGLLKSEETPTYRDEYDLVWVDQPRDPWRLVVQGHTPRSYPHLFPRYLPQSEQMVFASSQGVSLVSVPNGELLHFWELVGTNGYTHVRPAPDEKALVAIAEERALYWIPLQH